MTLNLQTLSAYSYSTVWTPDYCCREHEARLSVDLAYLVHPEPSGLCRLTLLCWVWNLAFTLQNPPKFIGNSVYTRNAEQQTLSLVLDPLG